MLKTIMIGIAVACAALSAPARADEPYAVTPSGRTETVFGLSVVDTSDRIANGCADLGWTVVNTTSSMVVCEAQLSTMQSVLAAMLIGNSYSTPPKQFLRFNLVGLGRGTRAQATGWIETQMAFGQIRTQEMTAANYHNDVMNLFTAIGGEFPAGTIFPNHAYFGSGFEPTSGNRGLRIKDVQSGSPAERGGLQNGDVLTRLARERIKSGDDLLDGLRKAVKAETYEVEVERGGQPMKLTLEREFRPEAQGPDLASLPPEPINEPVAVQQVLALSPADELAKFAKLRDDGIITDAEFDAQKVKLLGN